MGMAEQRDFLLCQIDRHLRKAKAGESANRKRVRIVNPGATVFRIKNCEKALRSFRKLVEEILPPNFQTRRFPAPGD
jgi:hypothetical protein